MSDTIGVGLIGCGGVAHIHTASLRDLAADGVPIRPVAAADPVPENREAVARNFAFERFYDDATELLADDDVDAVYVCTPTALHRDLYLATLEAGKHLYAEKPVAADLATVREISEAAAAADVVAQVGFQFRFCASLAKARAMVLSGELGPAMAYQWRDDEAFPTTAVSGGPSDWRSQRTIAGGGALLEHSIHAIDILGWTFGDAVRVGCATRGGLGFDVEDTAAVTLEHDSGTVGTLVSVYGGVVGREESRFEVFCERGIIEVAWGVLVDSPENSFRVQRSGEAAEAIDPGEILSRHLDEVGVARRPFFWNELASRAFFRAILDGHAAQPGFSEAVVAHATVEAAYRAADEHRLVGIAELSG